MSDDQDVPQAPKNHDQDVPEPPYEVIWDEMKARRVVPFLCFTPDYHGPHLGRRSGRPTGASARSRRVFA